MQHKILDRSMLTCNHRTTGAQMNSETIKTENKAHASKKKSKHFVVNACKMYVYHTSLTSNIILLSRCITVTAVQALVHGG